MANMNKWEINEVNCPESFVTVSIRGDLIGTIVRCLRQCHEDSRHAVAAWTLSDLLARAGDMIYKVIPAENNLDVADVVVCPDGLEVDNLERKAG